MINIIPLEAIPNQRLSVRLGDVEYDIEINLRRGDLYMSAWANNVNIVNNRVMRSYAPMVDGFIMVGMEGVDDPVYQQLGTRFLLMKDDG